MATSINFIAYVCQQLFGTGNISYKKMFGEYMIYLNDKPVIVVCNNTAYVKKLDCIKELMEDASVGFPYKGANEHYILDIDNAEFSKEIVIKVEKEISLPKKKN